MRLFIYVGLTSLHFSKLLARSTVAVRVPVRLANFKPEFIILYSLEGRLGIEVVSCGHTVPHSLRWRTVSTVDGWSSNLDSIRSIGLGLARLGTR